MLTKIEREKAKELALLAIKNELDPTKNEIEKIKMLSKELDRYSAGVFVTLKIKEELRGCIGFPIVRPLGRSIIQAAKLAAFNDPRFMPLTKEELEKIKIEITLLSTPEEIKTKKIKELFESIQIGKHGLIVNNLRLEQSGLLLPQVAIEHSFDALTFLQQTCLKAGLNKDAWQDKDTKIFRFEGEWF
ncbi:MAG: AmmeMemoRadiSam system protein A [Candidatus Pacearchaeota archaeon]